jgi:diguanylate cyclase (GGDEF)-like protein/PAS domain S-box-containing protein
MANPLFTDSPTASSAETHALQARTRALHLALSLVSDGVIACDHGGRILYMNEAAETLTGWAAGFSLGRDLDDVFRVMDVPTQPALHRPFAKTDRPFTPAALLDHGGHTKSIEYEVRSLHDGVADMDGILIICRALRRDAADGTDSNALFAERERAKVTLDSIGDAVISIDFSGQVMYLNNVAERMTGWGQELAAGRGVDEVFQLFDALSHEMVRCPTTQAIIEDRKATLNVNGILRSRSGEEFAVEVSATPIHDQQGGVIGAVMVVHDVTTARELSQRLARQALHDGLTGLPNRTLFNDRLSQAITSAARHGHSVSLLYVDLDHFKDINDNLGHHMGDMVLQEVARRLLSCVRATDTVSRQGGDEFLVMLGDGTDVAGVDSCAKKILRALNSPCTIEGHTLALGASIGVARLPDHAPDAGTLIRRADEAMYRAKCSGRGSAHFYQDA